jgi:uncharacterized protein with NAD-binding domain and iron-sulfur cluster
MANTPQKIAILGGGIAALTTAFELSSQPDWQSKFDITLYQMGWRLGGKCATGRGPNGRIQEHGIHGFLGSYYNALPLMVRCYAELGRAAGQPLATFEEAFKPSSFVLMWEFENGGLKRWPFTAPTNARLPSDPSSLQTLEHWTQAGIGFLREVFDAHHESIFSKAGIEQAIGHMLLGELEREVGAAPKLHGGLLGVINKVVHWAQNSLQAFDAKLDADHADLRRLLIVMDYFLTMVRGVIADDIMSKGFDSVDNENFSDWFARHGASPITISSPMALNTTNLSYQYPEGDTARTALMAAGTYLHWSLRSFAYMGAFAWLFEAGTGETIIAPLYEVLKKRGVKFEFFHKVRNLGLSNDKTQVQSIDFDVQATLKAPSKNYQPLIDVKGLPAWPLDPQYDQLNEGAALQAQDIDLESYWTPWQPVAQKTLQAGQDFDRVVFAISIGAVPYLCQELMAAQPAWQTMCKKVTTVQTQTMQLWLKRSTTEMGWDIPMKGANDIVIGATYINPLDGQVDFSHLIQWEDWPQNATPKSLWYFSGCMDDYETPPPLTDHDYPRRQSERVKAQCIQFLQASIGPLLPKATTNAVSPPGDPMSLDFGLLQGYDEANAGHGIKRFNQQFWRANIDPTERYVTSPPGSTAARIKAWDTGFNNLAIAGDWIYTGLNVGSVEGTVMGGKLASFAVSGLPALADIVGYPSAQGPTL